MTLSLCKGARGYVICLLKTSETVQVQGDKVQGIVMIMRLFFVGSC